MTSKTYFILLLPFILAILSTLQLKANSMPADSIYCDTLLTNDGNTYLVNIKNRDYSGGDLRFTICGDDSGAIYTLTRKKVRKIKWAANAMPAEAAVFDQNQPDLSDRLVRRSKTAFLLSWLSWVMISTFILIIPGIIFAIIAIAMGEKVQREVTPQHRWYEFIQKRSRNAIYISLALFALVILAIILI
jgi:hypothetical protein